MNTKLSTAVALPVFLTSVLALAGCGESEVEETTSATNTATTQEPSASPSPTSSASTSAAPEEGDTSVVEPIEEPGDNDGSVSSLIEQVKISATETYGWGMDDVFQQNPDANPDLETMYVAMNTNPSEYGYDSVRTLFDGIASTSGATDLDLAWERANYLCTTLNDGATYSEVIDLMGDMSSDFEETGDYQMSYAYGSAVVVCPEWSGEWVELMMDVDGLAILP